MGLGACSPGPGRLGRLDSTNLLSPWWETPPLTPPFECISMHFDGLWWLSSYYKKPSPLNLLGRVVDVANCPYWRIPPSPIFLLKTSIGASLSTPLIPECGIRCIFVPLALRYKNVHNGAMRQALQQPRLRDSYRRFWRPVGRLALFCLLPAFALCDGMNVHASVLIFELTIVGWGIWIVYRPENSDPFRDF